jgi:hypothetical protein
MATTKTTVKPTQKDRILTTLRQGKTLTQAQARARGIMSLSSRVNELRQSGVSIASTAYQNRAGQTVVRYSLSA